MTKKEDSIRNKTFFDTDFDGTFEVVEEKQPAAEEEEQEEEIQEEPKKKPAPKAKEKEKVEEEVEEVEEAEAEEEEQEEETAEEQEEEAEAEAEDTEFSFSPLVSDLIDNGILDVEDVSKFEDSPEGFREIVEETVTKRFDEMIKSLSPKAQELLEIEKNGGDFTKLLEIEATDYGNIDLEDEGNQKLLITEKLLLEGWEREDIDEKLSDLETLNKLEKEAKIAHKFLSKKQDEERQAFIEKNKKEAEASIERQKKDAADFKKKVLSTSEIAGMKLTKRDTEALYDYVTKPVRKDKSGRPITQYEIDSDLDNKLKQAYFQMIGYDLGTVETKVKTKLTKDLKKEISKYTSTNASGTSGRRPREVEEKQSVKIPDFWAPDRSNVL